jgi:hypothetical protein
MGGQAARAAGPAVTISNVKVWRTSKGYKVTGEYQARNLNQWGIPEHDTLQVLADIKLTADAIYPERPTGMTIRKPAHAETSFTRGGKHLTRAEMQGTNVAVVNVWSAAIRPGSVWRRHGGINEWEKNAPDTVEGKFEGMVPLEYGDKPLRLRARLTHNYGGPYAAWPGVIYRSDVWPIAPDLKTVAVIDPTDPELGDPEVLKLMEKLRKEREWLAKLQAVLKTQKATLKEHDSKMWGAMNSSSVAKDSAKTFGGKNYADKAGHIMTNAGGGPSLLVNESPVIGTHHHGKQKDMAAANIKVTEQKIAAQKKKIAALQQQLNKLKAAKGA